MLYLLAEHADNEARIVAPDRSAGTGTFYAVSSHGGMHLLREYDDWLTSWDLAVTGGWAGPDNSGLLLYDRAAGVSDHQPYDPREPERACPDQRSRLTA